MKVLGITSGIGFLQYGFKQEGFEVCLSHECRKYFNINKTFERNYFSPLTIREKVRIQGFDDDFIFYPLEYQYGSIEHLSLIKQTGKCMPIQFAREFARQLKNFINNGVIEETETRLLKQI